MVFAGCGVSGGVISDVGARGIEIALYKSLFASSSMNVDLTLTEPVRVSFCCVCQLYSSILQ